MSASSRRRRWILRMLAGVVLLGSAGWLEGCNAGPRGPGPNVLLIVVDTLRRDHVGLYGYDALIDSRARTGDVERRISETLEQLRAIGYVH